jgi:hypothetical protein
MHPGGTGKLWACIGYHVTFQTAAQLLLGDRNAVIMWTGPDRSVRPMPTASVVTAIVTAIRQLQPLQSSGRMKDQMPPSLSRAPYSRYL